MAQSDRMLQVGSSGGRIVYSKKDKNTFEVRLRDSVVCLATQLEILHCSHVGNSEGGNIAWSYKCMSLD